MGTDVIDIQGLTRLFQMGDTQVRAVDGLDLRVERGEFLAIMGASGSGKSTLMNLLGCLDTPTAGRYVLDGEVASDLDDDALSDIRNRKIGFVFQTFNLLPRLTAMENVELPLVYARVSADERRDRATRILERVGLSDRTDHRPNQLSGGQRQRVAIARALVHEPSLILADEPTGNLDSETSAEILQLFDRLHEEGNTLVMVTHDEQVGRRSQRMLRMLDGKIVEEVTCAA